MSRPVSISQHHEESQLALAALRASVRERVARYRAALPADAARHLVAIEAMTDEELHAAETTALAGDGALRDALQFYYQYEAAPLSPLSDAAMARHRAAVHEMHPEATGDR